MDQQGEDLGGQSLLQDLKQLSRLAWKLTPHDDCISQMLDSVCDVSLRDQSFTHLDFVQEVTLNCLMICGCKIQR
jgi:hypothetical protein